MKGLCQLSTPGPMCSLCYALALASGLAEDINPKSPIGPKQTHSEAEHSSYCIKFQRGGCGGGGSENMLLGKKNMAQIWETIKSRFLPTTFLKPLRGMTWGAGHKEGGGGGSKH